MNLVNERLELHLLNKQMSRSIRKKDKELFKSLWASDGIWKTSNFTGTSAVRHSPESEFNIFTESNMRYVSRPIEMTIDKNKAKMICKVFKRINIGKFQYVVNGYSEDYLVRENNSWKYVSRKDISAK